MDNAIALQYQPTTALESPLNMMAKLSAIRGAQQENAMRQAQMENYRSEIERRNAMLPFEQAEARSKQDTADLTREKSRNDLVKERMGVARQELDTVTTPEQYIAWHEANHKDPILAQYFASRGITAEQSRANIAAALQTPNGFEQLLQNSRLGTEKAMDNLLKGREQTRLEGTAAESIREHNLTAGTARRGQDIQAATARAGQDVTMRGQDMTAAEAEAKRKQDLEGLGTKLDIREKAKREAQYPQATVAVRSTEADADRLIGQLRELKTHSGLSGITGSIYGRTPSISPEATGAQALYDTVVAKGGFAMLQNLRNMSKTGGALGAVSDKEGEALRASFGTLGRVQSTAEFKKRVEETIADLERTKRLARESYDATYEYKQGAGQTGGGTTGRWGEAKPVGQ
jgi:hypothetical protein